jgi:hypothetical protein
MPTPLNLVFSPVARPRRLSSCLRPCGDGRDCVLHLSFLFPSTPPPPSNRISPPIKSGMHLLRSNKHLQCVCIYISNCRNKVPFHLHLFSLLLFPLTPRPPPLLLFHFGCVQPHTQTATKTHRSTYTGLTITACKKKGTNFSLYATRENSTSVFLFLFLSFPLSLHMKSVQRATKEKKRQQQEKKSALVSAALPATKQ